MATVELAKLSKRFGAHVALDALDLSIPDGEFLVLLGPSGCGKSTTMRLIAGLDEPSAGEIRIDGRCVNDRPARDRDLAMVFQNYALYPHMTVGENIGYPLKIRRIAKAERQARVDAAAAKVELGALLARRPAELSGGQRQRVALARAIVRRPGLFLMDEPLSNLDAKLRTVMRAELKHLQRELGITTVYVTHDQVEAMTLADRIVILNDARIQQTGTPSEIYARPANAFVASFIGSPPMNLVPGRGVDGQFRTGAGALPSPGVPAGAVTLGVRPEDLRVGEPRAGGLVGEVFTAELLGDCKLLNVRIGDALLVARVAPDSDPAIGESVALHCDASKMHFFESVGEGKRCDTAVEVRP